MRKRNLQLLLAGVAALICLGACQAEDTNLPEPTLTPIPPTLQPSATIDWFPRTPTPTPALSTTPEPLKSTTASLQPEDLIASDDFTDQQIWQTSSAPCGTVAYEVSSLSLAVSGGKNTLTSLSSHELPADFYLELNLDAQMCSPEDQYGLILWNNSSSGTFRVWFSCAGEVMLDRVLPSGTTVLQKWQTARKFQIGSPAKNRIGIRSQNNSLEVSVNGTNQFTYSPLNKLSGPLGVIAQSSGDLPLTVQLSNLQILKP